MHAIGFISAFVIWKSQNSIAVVTSMILLGAYIAATLTKALWKAYAATVFHGLTAFVSQMRQKIESGEWDCHFAATVADNNGANPEKIETDRHGKMQLLYITNFGFGFAADRVYEVARSRKVDLYLMLTVFFAAFQIIVGFAVEFLGLNFVNASSFSDAEGATFFDFLGFSLSVFSTVEVSPIAAVTQWARLLCYLEVGCLMLFVFIIVFTVLTAARETYREDIERFIAEVQASERAVTSLANKVYQFSIDELEQRLLVRDSKFVNFFRRFRGLPALSSPETTQALAKGAIVETAHPQPPRQSRKKPAKRKREKKR